MKFIIEITKDVIQKSLMCGQEGFDGVVTQNCAFAVAYNQLVKFVYVGPITILFYKTEEFWEEDKICEIDTTLEQTNFIYKFDEASPEERWNLVGRKFEVEVPDEVINFWYPNPQDAVDRILKSRCLSLCE